jgi:hypothetical protein
MNELPLYMKDAFGHPAGLVIATALGFAFGFVLERSGFGRASILAAQFYFTNLRVLKVMFAAIVTALLGITILSGLGILDLEAMRVPETWLWPQLVGGLLLGAGFIISGYCPGTGVVALASGKWDGLVAIVGVMLGSVAFGFAYPFLAGFYTSGHLGVLRLPELLGLPQAVVAAAVVLMALGMFAGGEIVERKFGPRGNRRLERPRSGDPVHRRRVFAGLSVAMGLGVLTLLAPKAATVEASRGFGSMSARELATRLVEDPSSVWLVDLRDETESRIPGAIPLAGDDTALLADLPSTRSLVLYAEADPEVPASAHHFDGDVFVLEGGYRAFAREILEPPVLSPEATAHDVDDYRLLSALHAYFTGASVVEAPPAVTPRKLQRKTPKKGGGC